MIHYVPICIILAILGTLLVNPTMYYHFFSRRLSYKKKLAKYEKEIAENPNNWRITKPQRNIFDCFPIWLIIGQIIAFACIFAFCLWGFYSGVPMAVKYSAIFAYLWVPAISQLINWMWYQFMESMYEDSSFESDISDSIYFTCLILAAVFIVISIGVGVHNGVYNYLHTYEDITFIEETHEEYPTVDEATLLQTANLASGSTIYSAVYRNGSWIYPVVNSSSNVASSGYLIVDSTQKDISFVPKEISYSPWISNVNNVFRVARRYDPSAVFFGNVSFQVEPETGDIYFALFYGDYACFRAGRKVEGVILINASTGECKPYTLSDIPDWVTGVSF